MAKKQMKEAATKELFEMAAAAIPLQMSLVLTKIIIPDYPLRLEKYNKNKISSLELRIQPNRIFNDNCKLTRSESSFHIDAARIWNAAPCDVRLAPSIDLAKKRINLYCRSLPV